MRVTATEIRIKEQEAFRRLRKQLEPVQERLNTEVLDALFRRTLDIMIEIEMHDLMA